MKIVVHGGLGKTATTWLQGTALPSLGVTLLAKGGALDGSEGHPNDHLRVLQYEVFSPIYGPPGMWKRYRNSANSVKEYGDALVREIRSSIQSSELSNEKFVAVLSDESLLSYGGYEVNAVPLTLLLRHLMEAFSQDQEVELEVVLTIREQSSFPISYYSYDFANLISQYRSFDSFIESGIDSPSKEIFGMLFYDDAYAMLKSVFPEYVKVRFVPFERLRVEGGRSYVEDFLGLGRTELTRNIESLAISVVNGTQSAEYRCRDQYRRSLVANRLRIGVSRHATKPAIGVVSKLLSNPIALRVAPTDPTRIRKTSVSLTERQEDRLREIYGTSNSNIEKTLGLGLGELGYTLSSVCE